jgi:hypothetical protein
LILLAQLAGAAAVLLALLSETIAGDSIITVRCVAAQKH